MNLLASYKWLKEYVRTNLSPEELASQMSLSGPSIERIYLQGENLEKIVVGEVVKLRPHPNADTLRLATTRIGREVVEVVCGGTNLKEGMRVAVALTGARVRWHGEGELVELKPTEIRGVKSHGMICAANEIGLFEYFPHAEREILDVSFVEAAPGTSLREALELDDVIFDIEVTTNRPDALSIVGLAREAAAILVAPFVWKPSLSSSGPRSRSRASLTRGSMDSRSPMPLGDKFRGNDNKLKNLEIKIEASKLCPRYQAAVLTNVQVRPSPWWMQKRLLAAGIRPISNVVDITNYVMLELGQPMHAFDADRLRITNTNELRIIVRMAEKGEKLRALDGNTYELDSSMLVIADARRPIAIAGVMGGEETGVTRDTTTIIFESATFDPVSVRRTARALNLQSDSSLRFEKGLSTESTTAALARAVELAQKLAGATLVSPLLDRRVQPYKPISFSWDPEESARKIGISIPAARMRHILETLGFEVTGRGKAYKVRVPYWRDHDIEDSNDFAEEIARIYGYHKLPSVIPAGEIPVREEDPRLVWEDRLREALCGAGFTEIYSYSFVSEALLGRAGWGDALIERVQNPLTVDFAVMRPALVPSLLEVVRENENEFPIASIFEVANVYIPRPNDLPLEVLVVGGAVWSDDAAEGSFFRAKGALELIAARWNVPLQFVIASERSERGDLAGLPRRPDKIGTPRNDVLHPGRRAALAVDDAEIGFLGELHPIVQERMGIRHRVAAFQFDLMEFVRAMRRPRYEPPAAFPPVRRDISFVVSQKTTYDEVRAAMRGAGALLHNLELFDVYEGKGIPEGHKSMAFHLTFTDPTRTLTGEEVDAIFGRVVKSLRALGAEVRLA